MIRYLRFEILSGTLPIHVYGIIPPPIPKTSRSRGKQTWIETSNATLFMNFLLLNVAFVI